MAAPGGFVVERVSGVNWESYVESQILKPLGIEDATFAQPLPAGTGPRASQTGYRWSNGAFMSQGFEYVPLGAGSRGIGLRCRHGPLHDRPPPGTAAMATRALCPEWTARQMHEPLYRAAPQFGSLAARVL